jgi:hypothetical protein
MCFVWKANMVKLLHKNSLKNKDFKTSFSWFSLSLTESSIWLTHQFFMVVAVLFLSKILKL